jgi:hypothetical protein
MRALCWGVSVASQPVASLMGKHTGRNGRGLDCPPSGVVVSRAVGRIGTHRDASDVLLVRDREAGGMQETAACDACQCRFRRELDASWKKLRMHCWRATRAGAMPPPVPAAQPQIPKEMLRRLLQLTHPDRHAGSEAAQIATRWLLEQRGRGG